MTGIWNWLMQAVLHSGNQVFFLGYLSCFLFTLFQHFSWKPEPVKIPAAFKASLFGFFFLFSGCFWVDLFRETLYNSRGDLLAEISSLSFPPAKQVLSVMGKTCEEIALSVPRSLKIFFLVCGPVHLFAFCVILFKGRTQRTWYLSREFDHWRKNPHPFHFKSNGLLQPLTNVVFLFTLLFVPLLFRPVAFFSSDPLNSAMNVTFIFWGIVHVWGNLVVFSMHSYLAFKINDSSANTR